MGSLDRRAMECFRIEGGPRIPLTGAIRERGGQERREPAARATRECEAQGGEPPQALEARDRAEEGRGERSRSESLRIQGAGVATVA